MWLGITQLAKNNAGVARRNDIANRYKAAFEGVIKFQLLPDNTYNAHHLFVIEVDYRKELYDLWHQHGILAQIHYIPVHQLPYYKKIGYEDANLKNANNYYDRCISLPMFPSLTNEDVDFVISKTLEFIDTYSK